MKKKLGVLLFSCLLAFLLTSCDEVLSIVTVNAEGKKVVNSYVSMMGDTVYDKNSSMKSWQDIELFDGEDVVDMDDLLFKIVNKKEKIVVFGDEGAAVEMRFFDGGYNYKLYTSADSLQNVGNSLNF